MSRVMGIMSDPILTLSTFIFTPVLSEKELPHVHTIKRKEKKEIPLFFSSS